MAETMPGPRAVGGADFATQVLARSADVPVLVDFWAAWCGPCRAIAPILERLATDYVGRVDITKVDADVEQELSAQYGVRSLPTLAVFRHGRLVDAVIGAQPEGVLRELLERHLERPGDREREAAVAAAVAGDTDGAVARLAVLCATETDRPEHVLALLDVLLEAGRLTEAAERLARVPVSLTGSRELARREARLEIGQAAVLAGEPASAAGRQATAARAFLADRPGEALEEWLELMRSDPRYGDGAAQRALRAAFVLLGEPHALVGPTRRRMAALMH